MNFDNNKRMNFNNSGIEFSYLIRNDIDNKYGISVNTVGTQSINPNTPYPTIEHPFGYYFNTKKGRKLNEYQFVYITNGNGELTFESSKGISISRGQLIVIFPDQWHTYRPSINSGWDEYYIGFEGEIIENLIENSFFTKGNQVLNVGLNVRLVDLFKRAIEVAKLDRKFSQQHLAGIVMHMIGLVLSESQNSQSDIENLKQIIENAKIIMNENIYKKIHPEEIANMLNIKYLKFRNVFKKHTGYAPAKYFQELKIRKAKQFLQETSYSVKEISYKLNYYSPDRFNNVFKKSTGQTPSKYRFKCRCTVSEQNI